MPRSADPALTTRILNAASRLYKRQGEKGLTLRAVANEAGTTTPTVYNRFKSRSGLIRAMGLKVREDYLRTLIQSSGLEDACREYLEFAVKHPHEYQVVYGRYWESILSHPPIEPGMQWARIEFAKRFGGKPSDYGQTAEQIRLLLHGGAMMLVYAKDRRRAARIRKQCLAGCKLLINSACRKT